MPRTVPDAPRIQPGEVVRWLMYMPAPLLEEVDKLNFWYGSRRNVVIAAVIEFLLHRGCIDLGQADAAQKTFERFEAEQHERHAPADNTIRTN